MSALCQLFKTTHNMINGVEYESIEGSKDGLKVAVDHLHRDGYLRIKSPIGSDMYGRIAAAAEDIERKYPNGFVNKGVYSNEIMEARAAAPKTTDRAPTAIYPNVGFLAPDLLLPLTIPAIRSMIESMVGEDYYLSNTWMQRVPPDTGRMAFHKDPRGSITFVLMLDDIDDDMGSTNLVPRSHLNTPPPAYCMSNIQQAHPEKIDLTGKRGDIVFFTPETWHARAENKSQSSTRRLFYNFYSKSSKASTSWANAVTTADLQRVQTEIPDLPSTLFSIDTMRTESAQEISHTARVLALGQNSHESVRADVGFSRAIYGKTCLINTTAHTKSYTNRSMERAPFKLTQYVRHFKFVPTFKIAVKRLMNA